MSRLGDLVRSLRTQPQRIDAQTANAVLERARAEGVSPAELKELSALLKSELGDKFSPQLRDSLTRFVEGSAPSGSKPVQDLLPELELIASTADIPKRFATDLVLLRDQLINLPNLPASEKSERLFEFMLAYAERFVALANGEARVAKPAQASEVLSGDFVREGVQAEALMKQKAWKLEPLSRAEREQHLRAFAKALEEGGFDRLRDPRTGKDGVKIATELLSSRTVEELRRKSDAVQLESAAFQKQEQAERAEAAQLRSTSTAVPAAPSRELGGSGVVKDRARLEVERLGGTKLDPMKVQPWQVEAGRVVVQPVPKEALGRVSAGEPEAAKRSTSKVLGRNMLWNWLHTYRDGGEDEVERGHNVERLTFGVVALLIAAAVVAVVLVSVG